MWLTEDDVKNMKRTRVAGSISTQLRSSFKICWSFRTRMFLNFWFRSHCFRIADQRMFRFFLCLNLHDDGLHIFLIKNYEAPPRFTLRMSNIYIMIRLLGAPDDEVPPARMGPVHLGVWRFYPVGYLCDMETPTRKTCIECEIIF